MRNVAIEERREQRERQREEARLREAKKKEKDEREKAKAKSTSAAATPTAAAVPTSSNTVVAEPVAVQVTSEASTPQSSTYISSTPDQVGTMNLALFRVCSTSVLNSFVPIFCTLNLLKR